MPRAPAAFTSRGSSRGGSSWGGSSRGGSSWGGSSRGGSFRGGSSRGASIRNVSTRGPTNVQIPTGPARRRLSSGSRQHQIRPVARRVSLSSQSYFDALHSRELARRSRFDTARGRESQARANSAQYSYHHPHPTAGFQKVLSQSSNYTSPSLYGPGIGSGTLFSQSKHPDYTAYDQRFGSHATMLQSQIPQQGQYEHPHYYHATSIQPPTHNATDSSQEQPSDEIEMPAVPPGLPLDMTPIPNTDLVAEGIYFRTIRPGYPPLLQPLASLFSQPPLHSHYGTINGDMYRGDTSFHEDRYLNALDSTPKFGIGLSEHGVNGFPPPQPGPEVARSMNLHNVNWDMHRRGCYTYLANPYGYDDLMSEYDETSDGNVTHPKSLPPSNYEGIGADGHYSLPPFTLHGIEGVRGFDPSAVAHPGYGDMNEGNAGYIDALRYAPRPSACQGGTTFDGAPHNPNQAMSLQTVNMHDPSQTQLAFSPMFGGQMIIENGRPPKKHQAHHAVADPTHPVDMRYSEYHLGQDIALPYIGKNSHCGWQAWRGYVNSRSM